MKYLRKFNESIKKGPGRYKKSNTVPQDIMNVIDFINPSDLMSSGEKSLYHLADDYLYSGDTYHDDGSPVNIKQEFEESIFNKDSDSSNKFGYDFLMSNKETIMKILVDKYRKVTAFF